MPHQSLTARRDFLEVETLEPTSAIGVAHLPCARAHVEREYNAEVVGDGDDVAHRSASAPLASPAVDANLDVQGSSSLCTGRLGPSPSGKATAGLASETSRSLSARCEVEAA